MSDDRAAGEAQPVKRRLRGKQAAPAYNPPEEERAPPEEEPEVRRRPARRGRSEEPGPSVKRRPAARREPAVKRRPAARREPAIKRRPAARTTRPSERCQGLEGADCVFSTQEIGEGARVHPKQALGTRCAFCSADNLRRCLGNARGKGQISSALAFFEEHDANVFGMACARVSNLETEEALEACLQRLRRLQKKGASKAERQQGQKDKREARKADEWDQLLVERKAQVHFSSEDKEDFRRRAQPKEKSWLGKKFPGVYTAEGQAKRPGAGWQTPLAASFRRWAEEHSWNICQQCSRLVPKKFHPKHARASGSGPTLKHSVKACKHCARGVGYPVPQPADVPEPLRKLPQEVLDALAIFQVHTGPWEQEHNAYRAHMAPVRFSWHWQSVEERLAELESERHWEKGKAAFEWLRSAAQSSYKHFLQGHRAFLKQREARVASGDADINEPIKWLPLRFMETAGLECAVWPHLYWKTEMTETWVRSQDVRRQARLRVAEWSQMDWEDRILIREEEENRRRFARAPRGDSSSSEGEGAADEEAEPEERKRTSAKASFVAKIFSPVMGYGACYELQHFVYDLWLASSLGGARNAASTTLRGALAGRVFSPMYWQTQHAALVDCVRQIGLPHLFITIAPLEASAPYHAWMQDELEKLLRKRTRLPGAETFHLAHLLMQAAEGLLGGTNQRKKEAGRCWTKHALSGAGGEQAVLELFVRLEFQDGKRRRHMGPSQSYHGSGRAHLHMLIWLSDPMRVDWAEVLRADLPSEDAEAELRSIVEESQLDWQNSGWPLREERTAWENGALRLRHPASAKAAKVRAWMPDVLGALQCHMDVQVGDGRALLLQYAASYTSKFSDQFATSWLNEEASDYHLARKVLSEYHPLEPEMWLQLGSHEFRQVLATGVVRRLVVRVPDWENGPADGSWEAAYVACKWRSEDHCLLDYLRLSNKDGGRRKNARRVCVAAIMNSRLRDDFYGQWLLLNVPFRSLADLWDDRAMLVPEGYRMLALCLLKRRGFFRAAEVRKEMLLEGDRSAHIDNVLAMLEGRKAVVQAYLDGEWTLEDHPEPPVAARGGLGGELDPEQTAAVNAIHDMTVWALERRYPQDVAPEELEALLQRPVHQAPREMRPLCVLGPAGSGKSTAVKVAIQKATEGGGHVGIACPTGVLASSYREEFPDLDVDTLHGMFLLHLTKEQAYETMSPFDLIVIDEVGQLSQETFEKLMWLWDNADRRPALVFVGDFHQLRGMDSTRATDSSRWRQVIQRHLRTMRRCQCPELKWKLELLRSAKPSKEQLLRLLRGHRAMPDRGPGYSPEPTNLDVEGMLRETPNTTFVTITRRAAAVLNELSLEALFSDAQPEAVALGDPEDNLDNYDSRGRQIGWEPARLPIFVGARVTLTRNLDKPRDFVNGMSATVMGIKGNSVAVQTKTGKILTVFPYTDEEVDDPTWRRTFLPMRLGYAATLQKLQGATLDHATIWLDRPNIEAAGYVALSRVRKDADWRFIGHMTPHHFTPASGV